MHAVWMQAFPRAYLKTYRWTSRTNQGSPEFCKEQSAGLQHLDLNRGC